MATLNATDSGEGKCQENQCSQHAEPKVFAEWGQGTSPWQRIRFGSSDIYFRPENANTHTSIMECQGS
jgi:hypothetical protein